MFRAPHRIRAIASLCCLAFLLTPGYATADLFIVGSGDGCSNASLDSALTEAKRFRGPDEIRLTETIEYRQIAATIDNLDVTITGGYSDCRDTTPESVTSLDGFGGSTRSVLEIRGGGVVKLRGLEIRNGDEDDDSDGGGIDYKGNGSLLLENLSLNGNRAGYGGAISFRGDGAGATLTLGDVVIIQNNEALHNGGGIHLSGRATLTMVATNTIMLGNRALGLVSNGQDVDGIGGGLYVKAPATADLGSSGLFASGVSFFENEARLGGGIAVVGAGGTSNSVRVYSAYPQSPQRLLGNRARQKGGAIFVRSSSETFGGLSAPSVCVFDTAFENNTAPRGAAVQLDTFDDFDDFTFGTRFSLNRGSCSRPAAAAACPAGRSCSLIAGNRSADLDGTRRDGGVFEAEENSEITLGDFVARDNEAGSLLRTHDNQYGSPDLLNCVIWRNDFTRYLAEAETSRIGVHQCTISGNSLHGSYVFKMEADNEGARHDTITNSIIDQPAQIAVQLSGDRSKFGAAHVFTLSPFFDVPASNLRYISGEEPGFVDALNGDFRLAPGARTIDYAPYYNDGVMVDIIGNARSVDRPERNLSGLRDVGAYETPN